MSATARSNCGGVPRETDREKAPVEAKRPASGTGTPDERSEPRPAACEALTSSDADKMVWRKGLMLLVLTSF